MEIQHIFSQLIDAYEEQIFHVWQAYSSERLCVIDIPTGPTEILGNDPHKDKFMRDTVELGLSSTAESPVVRKVSGYFLLSTRKISILITDGSIVSDSE